ncbi:Ig-like domain-containing protein [Mycolicibacterium sp.]|uniref:Ig-like domain-containing protein n=1 Tax=Mycolicibacterium sp. TaxID=2320850 RepID=UPI003D13A821
MGAASAGVGAALLGFSLMGPQVGVAAAEATAESSVSSSASKSDPGDTDKADTAADTGGSDTGESGTGESGTDESGTDESGTDESGTETTDGGDDTEADGVDDTETDDTETDDVETADDVETDVATATPAEVTDSDPVEAEPADETAERQPDTDSLADGALVGSTPATGPSSPPTSAVALQAATPQRPWREYVAERIDNWTARTLARIDSLNASESTKAFLEQAFWAYRRTFFNQAPTADPIQVSGVISGPITGSIGAVDPDGDRIVYRLVTAPRTGTVRLNADGTYTYTPDDGFTGVDTFRVIAVDLASHINLLDWFRPYGTRAVPLINQGAVKFEFTYKDAYWTDDRREALQRAADELLQYFRVPVPVVLTYDVYGQEDKASTILAQAGSFLTSTEPGFWRTIVQNKIVAAGDSNGTTSDGVIRVNFARDWALGDDVAPDQYDFTMALMHELLHSFGFGFPNAYPTDGGKRNWSDLARYVVAADGSSPYLDDYRWNSAYEPNLIRQNGGLFFGGPAAVAAYGGLVPLFTTVSWAPGTSLSHLDDYTFAGPYVKMMNASTNPGPRSREFSAVEIGILRDLGYTVVSYPQTSALAFVGFLFFGRARRKLQPASTPRNN